MKVVLCHGVFELLHYGHLLHLQEARTYGDILIVSVTADEFVNKGPGRPVQSLQQRMAVLRALAIVDEVRPSYAPGPEQAIVAIRPHFYVKGKEYMGKLKEQALVEQYGGKVVFTFDEVASEIHTTRILKAYAPKAA